MSTSEVVVQVRLDELERAVKRAQTCCEEAERRSRHDRTRARLAVCAGLTAIATAILVSPASRQALAQNLTLASLAARVTALEQKTSCISVVTSPDTSTVKELDISGVNVRIHNGTGGNTVNGSGNLIIGYDFREENGPYRRGGSHNLILGDYQNYSSYGSIVTGLFNNCGAPYCAMLGGNNNHVDSPGAVICGGGSNTVSADYSCVMGGQANSSAANYSTVLGGYNNTAAAADACIAGGSNNGARGQASMVSGGDSNLVIANEGSISGGQYNIVNSDYASILGGRYNECTGYYSCVSGGNHNFAAGEFSAVSGGYSGTADGTSSSVSGGYTLSENNENGWAGGAYHSP